MRALPVLLPMLLFAGVAGAEPCVDRLEVVSASATYKTRMFQNKPFRRDAVVEVTLRSSSTSAISAIELGIFLGASLEASSNTRPMTLPTKQYREFEGGGVAFRAEVPAVLLPKTSAKVQVHRKALPLEEDVYAVTVVPASCKTLVPVGDAVVEAPAAEGEGPPALLLILIGAVGLVIAVMILRQLR